MLHTAVEVPLTYKSPIAIADLEILEDEVNTSEEVDFFQDLLGKFHGKLNDEELHNYSTVLLNDFNEALRLNSPISMLPNFNIRPLGEEHGKFLIIDLGGSTLRISIIQIDLRSKDNETSDDRNGRVHIIKEKKWIMNNNEKNIDNEFFRFMGSKIVETISEQDPANKVIDVTDDVINVGITWSFPLEQLSHNSGRIVTVGKGWEIAPEIHNQDLKQVLETSVKHHFDINADVKVIINDSLAVYAAGSFLSSDLKLAMVLGTGYNVCCSLNTHQIHAQKTLQQEAVLINSEMSLFAANLHELANEFDGTIDTRFTKPSFKSHMSLQHGKTVFQPYEIMTSGRNLPELTRLSILNLIKNNEILHTLPSDHKLFTEYDGFSGEVMCFISETGDMNAIIQRFNQEFGLTIDEEEGIKIKQVVDSIIKRASYIITISIISFIKLLVSHNQETFPNKKLVIGYVGSILVYFNKYRQLILKYINENEYIQSLGITVELMSIDDSSIVGAAIGAAYYIE